MPSLPELAFQEQLAKVEENASVKGWDIKVLDTTKFVATIKAGDESLFSVLVDCDQFPSFPPVFHWYNNETKQLDQPQDMPKGNNGFFYSNGVVCAPWNRLAYSSENAKGPHHDWEIGNWQSNSKTGGCKTLSAMLIRIDYELKYKFKGRIA